MRRLAILILLGIVACGDDRSDQVTVFAAASLTEAFTEIGADFESAHPDIELTFNFAGSSELAAQINEGAPADVFAAADTANMSKISVNAPVTFATNSAAIAVGLGNPHRIDSIADLADPDLVVVLCAPEVPCGSYAAEIIAASKITIAPDSLERNVKSVVTKVAIGEADAGIVYRTDTLASERLDGIAIDDTINITAEYPIAIPAEAPNPGTAQQFIDYVLRDGQATLTTHGFGPSGEATDAG